MATQTRLESFYESLTNVWIGFGISFVANSIILPWVGLPVTVKQNLLIGLGMTFVSVARSYVIRRMFDTRIKAFNSKLAERTRARFLAWRGPV